MNCKKPSLPSTIRRCMMFAAGVLLLWATTACGTDSDFDGPEQTADVADDTSADTAGDVADSTDTEELDAVVDTDGEDTDENEDVTDSDAVEDTDSDDTSDAEDTETVEDVEVSDTVEDSETIEDTEIIEDTETVDDSTDTSGGGGVGTPCATHCRCAANLFCDNASGTCQPIVINTGFYCCSDGPEDCPDGAECDLDLPEGGEGVCGE